MRRLILTVLACAALGGPAAAEKTAYQCLIRSASADDWIQPLIFIAIDRVSSRVVVSDVAILASNDGIPVEGRLVRDNSARVTFAWELALNKGAGLPVMTRFRATYLKSDGKVNVSAHPRGFELPFNRGGTCTETRLSG